MCELVKNVFSWDHFLLYLSGPIDFDRTGGRDWRKRWTDDLVKIGFKAHQILNPCKKPLSGAKFNLDNEAELMDRHRSRREWKELMDIMSEIVHIDLRLVDKSDIILVNITKIPGTDYMVPTYGTLHEIVVARQQKKPVFLVWEGGKDSCSAWLMWLVGHRNVFASFGELRTRLENISKGKTAYKPSDWLLLNLDEK